MVDTYDSKSYDVSHESSSLSSGTYKRKGHSNNLHGYFLLYCIWWRRDLKEERGRENVFSFPVAEE